MDWFSIRDVGESGRQRCEGGNVSDIKQTESEGSQRKYIWNTVLLFFGMMSRGSCWLKWSAGRSIIRLAKSLKLAQVPKFISLGWVRLMKLFSRWGEEWPIMVFFGMMFGVCRWWKWSTGEEGVWWGEEGPIMEKLTNKGVKYRSWREGGDLTTPCEWVTGDIHQVDIVGKKRDPGILDSELFLPQIGKLRQD